MSNDRLDASVLIVGGTGGIGRALAERYASLGSRVVITSRDAGRAEAAAAEIGPNVRGIALDNKRPELDQIMGNNIYFDTCVYHQPGIDLLTKVVPVDNILFASEMVGAVRGDDPQTGKPFDDTKRYVDNTPGLSAAEKKKIFEDNAYRAYPRLKNVIAKQAQTAR